MQIVPGSDRARGPEGFVRGAPLARRAGVLQVLRLLQVSGRPALHGSAGPPLLLSGVQKESPGLDCAAQSSPQPGPIELSTWIRTGETNTDAVDEDRDNVEKVPGPSCALSSLSLEDLSVCLTDEFILYCFIFLLPDSV